MDTISAAVSEERNTIEDVCEPYLMQVLLFLTGNIIDDMAFVHHDQAVAILNGILHVVGDHHDVSGEEKKNLHVSDLLAKFQIASGGEFANDRMILS